MAERTCVVDECGKPIKARGWCNGHYLKWLRYGDPLTAKQMPPGTNGGPCSISGCTNRAHARGLCPTHLRRQRLGQPMETPVRVASYQGLVCSVDGCSTKVHSRGYCGTHYQRWWHHGDPLVVLPANGGSMPRDLHPMWSGDRVGYHGIHGRLQTERGRASSQPCADCGNPARDWSYDHEDPDERASDLGPYSLKLEHYQPRCSRCHRVLDNGRHEGWRERASLRR